MLCERCGRHSPGAGGKCGPCGHRQSGAPKDSRKARRSGRHARVPTPSEIAAADAVTAPVIFASEPPVPLPGKAVPLVALYPQAAGAAGGPPLLEPALPAESKTYELHSSMLPPSLGPSPDGAVTEMLPAYALPFEFNTPPKPLPPLPLPPPPGAPLSERLRAGGPPQRRAPPGLQPRRKHVTIPPLFANLLPPKARARPVPAAPVEPEAPAFFANQLAPERSSLPLLALALAGLATGLGGGYWLLQGRRTEQPPAAVTAPAPVAATPAPPAPAGPAVRTVRATDSDLDDVEPASLVAAMKPKAGAPPLTVVRAEGHGGSGDPQLAALNPGGCPDGMRFIPAGAFAAGSVTGEPGRGAEERALVARTVGAFCIDAFEYPNRAGTPPAVTVSWDEAQRACSTLGKRLCAEDEWEKACKGPKGQRFPYGEAFDPDACNTEDVAGTARTLAAAGRSPRCRSGYGVVDLSGNAAEWTASALGADRIVKGGAFDRADFAARCSARKLGAPAVRSATVGFRCCADSKL